MLTISSRYHIVWENICRASRFSAFAQELYQAAPHYQDNGSRKVLSACNILDIYIFMFDCDSTFSVRLIQ